MRALIQRVSFASVTVDETVISQIDKGLLVLFGLKKGDQAESLPWFAEKLIHLRIFEDDAKKMNRSLIDVGGDLLIVSQFTLYGECKEGRRPSFSGAMPGQEAESLYEALVADLRSKLGETRVKTGQFGAEMQVNLINEGPVTLLLEQ